MLKPRTPTTERPRCLTNLSFYFTEYSKNTTIHGIRFLGEKRRSHFERVVWLIVFGFSIYISVAVITKAYRKWERSPVVVAFATSETPIWKIPFPAVTICSPYKGDFKNVYRNNVDLKPEMFSYERYDYLNLVCSKNDPSFINVTDTVKDEMLRYLMLVTPYFTLWDCSWTSKYCDFPYKNNKFKPVLTSEGVCYTFNILDREELFTDAAEYFEDFLVPHQPPSQWSIEKGYTNTSEFQTFPFRTMVSGIQGGLQLGFDFSRSFNGFKCKNKFGYKVALHSPEEVPNLNQHHIHISPDKDISASVKPIMVTTSERIKSYKLEDRKCYFYLERRLRFFKMYNQANCLLECQTNYTYNRCGCVNFYMPRTNSTPICGFAKLGCLKLAAREFTEYEALSEIQQYEKSFSIFDRCNCLPSCYSLSFDIESSQTKYIRLLGNKQSGYFVSESNRYSRLQIYFKDMQFLTSERSELYGQTDFLASCGGLLGLFIGFSLISIVELLYFLTLRIVCNFHKHGRHYWSGAEK